VEVVDVAIVGAGPAGAAAAIELARAGLEVVVLDRATFPRDKCCGDGLTTGALRSLEDLGLRPETVPSWSPVDSCWIRSPSGRVAAFPFPAGGQFAAVARRADLDGALVELARAAGADVREGRAFRALTWSDQGVTVAAEGGGDLAARYVVGADGVWSPVRKAVGLADAGYLGDWHAFRQYVRAPGADARRLWVWFEPDLLPGYAWSFPLADGAANVGFGVRRTPGTGAVAGAERLRRLLATPHVEATLGAGSSAGASAEASCRAWPIPARLPSSATTGAGGRVLLVGDAARAADPLTGEGIAQALESAREAAAAIVTAGPDRPQRASTRYRAALRRGMAVDHRLAAALSRVLESELGARAAVRAASASPWTSDRFARWLFEDYPRAALVTPGRWRPGLLHGAGAFGVPGGEGAPARQQAGGEPVASTA
jgi:geranylgeranyl reductase family protein